MNAGSIRCHLVLPNLAVTLMIAASGAAPAVAQSIGGDEPAPTAAQVTIYGWAAGYGGTLQPGIGTPAVEVRKSFGELLEDLDAAVFVTGFARSGRLVAIGDFSRTVSSREGQVPTSVPSVPFIPAEGRLKQTSLTAAAGYRVVDQRNVSLDLLGGLRAWWIEPRVDVPALALSRRAEVSFVDPIAAARLNIGLAPGWSALLYGDVGGFGAGSDATGQAVATVNARVGKRVWLSAGYRYLAVDYRSRGVRIDTRLGGPLLGATLTF